MQPAEDDAVGVEDVDQSGETEPEPVDEELGRGTDAPDRRTRPQQIGGLLEQGDLGARVAARGVEESERVRLDVQAAAAAAVAGRAPRG